MTEVISNNSTLTFLGLLIPFLPLLGFVVNGVLGKYLPKGSAGWIGSFSVLAAFVCALVLFNGMQYNEALDINMFTWIATGDIHISFGLWIDALTLIMMMVVTGVGFLIHLYSIGYMHGDAGFTRFFTYLNLFIFFMLLLIMGSNYLMMFIGWEGVGLCSYLLIGFWYKNDPFNDAAQKAFVMNRIGDLGFLLGMFFILFHFGTLDIQTVGQMAPDLAVNGSLLMIITLLLFIGATGKSAQLPLYTWLPDAMAGPTPVSALIHAATMVTAGIYMIVRSNVLFALAPDTLTIVLWVGVATSILAAIIGLKQNDIKKVLAYSTVSQLGLMFVALGFGAFSSGIFHLVTHAFFKALLFLGAGSVIHALHGEQDIRKMGGLRKLIPITYITFILASLAISGFPLLSGFFSKDEILAHAFEQNKVVWILMSFSSILTAIYMFRLVFLTFFNDFRGSEETRAKIHESPWVMTLPLIVLCVLAVIGGAMGLPAVFHVSHWLDGYLSAVTAPSDMLIHQGHGISHSLEIGLMTFAGLAAIVAIWFMYRKYVQQQAIPESEETHTGFVKVIYNKFYVDELFDRYIVHPVFKLSEWLAAVFDKKIVDQIVHRIASAMYSGGQALRGLQAGDTGTYVFAMVLGIVLLFIIRLLI